ncbi:VOC family protein [Acinetobacter stercoris]|uniref:Uncharacterized protein n=1 Tax=Acinetobacter stercoris TaxID=2126983 RepID=A0A2U3N2A7_9GAMM|nr:MULTISPECIES: hypothetical protein [Acinetobacter]SPL71826.1 hypothetical protein KPC_3004 [Acinetobacter stercoris]
MSHVESKIENSFFAENLVSGPYERLFLEPGQEQQYIRNYIDFLDGRIEYVFRIEEYYNLMVVGLQSALGHVSLVVLEPEYVAKLPDFIQNTKIMFVVDDIEAVYRKAEKNGIPILQKRTPNIMGAQGRLELAPGYIIELAEATNKELFNPDIDALGLPPARKIIK